MWLVHGSQASEWPRSSLVLLFDEGKCHEKHSFLQESGKRGTGDDASFGTSPSWEKSSDNHIKL